MTSIQPHEYETYRLLILSGQISDEEVPKLLAENPDFARWYRERQGMGSAGDRSVIATVLMVLLAA